MKIGLFTAAIEGDNSGDAFIEDAVRRIVCADEYKRFPLNKNLIGEDIDGINSCDIAIICGTNLYQSVFACNLTVEILDQIKIPVIPMGIGASAPIGKVPKMNQDGISVVRKLHEKCVMSSVRDQATLDFLHSIGIENTMLTACPVLFHSLSCPDFSANNNGKYVLSIRKRLLHLDEKWEERQSENVEFLCKKYKPTLVLQSPYDIPVAEKLAIKYDLDIVYDHLWQTQGYIDLIKSQKLTFGHRLHYGMLSLSYGKIAYFIAHDSRVSEFCKMMGLDAFDLSDFSDQNLALNIDTESFPGDEFRFRWTQYAKCMDTFLEMNGLSSRMVKNSYCERNLLSIYNPYDFQDKPCISMLIDRPAWAYDISARQIEKYLKEKFYIKMKYVTKNNRLDPKTDDLLHVFFWGEEKYKQFLYNRSQIIKEVSSHRWEDDKRYGPCNPKEFAEKYLNDAYAVFCTSRRLYDLLEGYVERLYFTPNGFDANLFYNKHKRQGRLKVGWAGNINDSLKGFNDILVPACKNRFDLVSANGKISHHKMNTFYNDVDVYAVSSIHEGEPLTLIEAMAAGCFPVCTDVGIVPELICHKETGYIVKARTVKDFREAFEWCEQNLDQIRMFGARNAERLKRERNWQVQACFFKRAYMEIIANKRKPKFRNDDVSFDTPIIEFKRFCEIFHEVGLHQVHGVNIYGCTSTVYTFGGNPVEYEGYSNISMLPNEQIRKLSKGLDIRNNIELIDYLNSIPDELALHGLFHVDYSVMTYEEQKKEMMEALLILNKIFPQKKIKYFIPPFNRSNENTQLVCKELGLELLGVEGVHFEADLENLKVKSNTWYRYHHHRFYQSSKFSYYNLNFEILEKALNYNFSNQPKNKGLIPQIKQAGFFSKILNRLIN